MTFGESFIQESQRYLSSEYLPKIRRALEGLHREDLWWRPNPASNSIGNLILHLSGNVRQWIVAGIGGAEDRRDRQAEFHRQGGLDGEELLSHLQETLTEADGVLEVLPAGRLSESLTIQGLPVTVLQALYHVVEHFAMHTGQIIYLSKLRSGKDLKFYQVSDGDVTTQW